MDEFGLWPHDDCDVVIVAKCAEMQVLFGCAVSAGGVPGMGPGASADCVCRWSGCVVGVLCHYTEGLRVGVTLIGADC